jgi:hypothetical protein
VRITGVVGRVVEIRHCRDGVAPLDFNTLWWRTGRVPKYVNNSHEARKCHIYMLSPRSQIPEAPRVRLPIVISTLPPSLYPEDPIQI